MNESLTVRIAAQRIGCTEETIRRWLRSGHIIGVRPGGDRMGWRIPSSEVDRLLGRSGDRESALPIG